MELPPSREVNVFLQYMHKSKYSIVMGIYYKILHIFCFLDFGFFQFKSSKQRIFCKLITVIQVITLCTVCILTEDIKNNYAGYIYYGYLCCFFCNVLGLVLISPQKTLYQLFFDLEFIDYKLRINNAYLGVNFLTTAFLYLGIKVCILLYCIYCVYFKMPSLSQVIGMWSITSLHFVIISYSLAFYSINCRLKKLVSVLKDDCSDFSSLQLIYKSIVELTEGHKTTFDLIFILGLLINIPHIMATLFEAVQSFFDKNITEISKGMSFKYIIAANALMILFAPAICAGMLATQADRIKIILHDKLLHVCDVSRVREIERFIRYVEARGCRFRVWKLIPLDADLPGMLLSFCVTYLIVIVQFTNK